MKTHAGKRTRLIYPVHNTLLLPLEYLARDVLVVATRSIADQPLSLTAFLKRPFLRRGLTLITAIEDGQQKRFYRECCKGQQEPGLQLVLRDDDEPGEILEPIGRVFEPTVEDRQRMLDVIASLGPLPAGFSLCVRAVRNEPLAYRVRSSH